MPKRTLYATHEILLKMARQDFSAEDNGKPYIWQVRHGGMLGLKYEVAVRRDIVVEQAKKEEEAMDVDEGETTDEAKRNTDFLKSVVSTAILGYAKLFGSFSH
jgi:TATA-binding protein-associated factor